MNLARLLTRATGVMALLLAAGCTVGPDYRPPATVVPAGFRNSARTGAAAETNAPAILAAPSAELAALGRWWTVFGDPQLEALVRTAAEANLDVKLAAARVREARAIRGVARADQWPQVDARTGYSRSRLSENTPDGRQAALAGEGLEQDFFEASAQANWELDVFGGTRRSIEATTASLLAEEELAQAVWVSVAAEVGLSYLDLRGAQRQLAVARENLRLQEEARTLAEDRHRAGLVSELDVTRATALVEATRAQIPVLEESAHAAVQRLGVLLGRAPGDWQDALLASAPLPQATPRVPVGLPSELLLRRPDLRAAERRYAAAHARIGAATADLFPRFYLTGAAGLQSVEAADVFSAGSRFWSLGPTLRWPVFQGGRIRQNIRVEDARAEQALVRYEQAVLGALEEVENALVAFGTEQQRHEALRASEAAAARSAALAGEQYRSGRADFLAVLEADRSRLAAQDAVAQSERRLGQNLVRLYRALGGGWDRETLLAAGPVSAPVK